MDESKEKNVEKLWERLREQDSEKKYQVFVIDPINSEVVRVNFEDHIFVLNKQHCKNNEPGVMDLIKTKLNENLEKL